MARIQLKSDQTTNPEIKTIFDEIIEKSGKVPAAYRAFALHPHILQANWNRTKNILEQGNLPISLKEMIATRISAENGCTFCLKIHSENLSKLGFSESEISAVVNDKVQNKKLDRIMKFVTVASIFPQKISSQDFTELKKFGYSEADLLEMLTVMEMYTGYNKIIVALGIKDID